MSRAQQFLTSAQTVEQQYLAALQNKETEQEKLKQAEQTAAVAAMHASEMQDQVTTAGDDIQVFTDQQKRANQQAQTYASWLAQGPNEYEKAMLDYQKQAATAKDWQTSSQAIAAAASAIEAISTPWGARYLLKTWATHTCTHRLRVKLESM